MEERDIVWLSVPFTLGTATGALLLYLFNFQYLTPILSNIVIVILLCVALYSSEKNIPILVSLFFFAGIFSYSSFSLTEATRNTGFLNFFLQPEESDVRKILSECRRCCLYAIDELPFENQTSGAFLKAVLLGDKSSLPGNLIKSFQKSGTAHVLALSGLHLGIIYVMINKVIFISSPKIRPVKSCCIIIMTGFYVLITNSSPSMTRAFIFIIINEICLILNRKTRLSRTLFGAMLLQTAINPRIITDIGFQLSYSALAGITIMYPFMKKIFPEDGDGVFPFIKKIWDMASLTISCQFFTYPFSFYYFKSFPKFFLISNLQVVPLASAVIPASIIYILLNSAGIHSSVLTEVTEFLIQLLLKIVMVAGEMQ